MKPPALILITSTALAILLSSCATISTVQSRIAAYPDFFEKLSDNHKDLVRQHRVTEGMSKDAVYLAWGKADEIKTSSRNGLPLETWIYLDYKPIYTRSINVGYGGYGGGHYGRRTRHHGYGGGYYGGDFAYGTDVTYQPYVRAKVEFEKNRVAFWETIR